MEKEVQYLGEHLMAGKLGTFFISLSFASALVSILSYFLFFKNPEVKVYHRFSRIFYSIHVLSIFTVIGTLFFMMINHYFEYAYVWKHTDLQLESRYLFAAFWEDQEGSFLLWAFWHAVIGIVLMFTSGKWEAPVMMTLALVQVWLCTMVMGIYVGGHNIGTNPFVLMRDHPQFSNIPLFSAIIEKDGRQVVDYIEKLSATARGMNPLLKNYWMTIHPPTLFLGFALTVVPFCFSIAGLMTGKHKEWQKTALPWTFAGVAVLGTGILMGGAWAYEALSFGGFWAWDPVENASLVPWLTLVGTAHLMIINKNRKTSFFSTYLFSIITFILVLYSTFLTRSGILGDSSVHAFTDLGMERLLIYFVVIFVLIPVTLFLENKTLRINYFLISVSAITFCEIYGARSVVYLSWIVITLGMIFYQYFKTWNTHHTEESAWSREFWMFMGSMILFLLAISISGITSFPVFNRIFKTQFIAKDNGMNIYNIMGMIFGLFILLMMGTSQFLKYKNSDRKVWYKKTWISITMSLILTAIITLSYFTREAWQVSSHFQRSSFFIAPIFVFFSCYSFFANMEYLIKVLGGKIKNAGASIAHAGFALIMLGCVLSNSGKRVISQNTSGRDISGLGAKFSNNTNIYLEKGDTLKMGEYFISYKGKVKEGINVLYQVEYFSKVDGKLKPEFTLYPKIQLNKMMGNAAEPGTKHFLTKDIYTDITHAELVDFKEQASSGNWTETENNVLKLKDSIITNEYIITLDSLQTIFSSENQKKDTAITVVAVMKVQDMNAGVFKMYPKYIIKEGQIVPETYTDSKLGLKMVFWKINPEQETIEITLSQDVKKKTDYIVMEAFVFPWINILWTGCVIMVLGTLLALIHRIRQSKKLKAHEEKA